MEKKLLPYLVVLSALSVSLSAAFYSVTGIGKMFAGSQTNVMIMMSALEISKLVVASLLYQYWDKLNLALRFYYFIAVFVLMVITSGGIYGYLSSAYAETASKLEVIEKNVVVLDYKKDMWINQLDGVKSQKESLNENISELTKALSGNVIQYKDQKTGQIITTTSSANRKAFENQLNLSQERMNELSLKEVSINDSITKIELEKLDLETNTDIAAELGPIKYISRMTGRSMDEVVNWFIIALMLVFDPLAVSLVVGANVIFRNKRLEEEKEEKVIDLDKKIAEYEKVKGEFDERENEINLSKQELDNIKSGLEIEKAEIEDKLLKDIELKKSEALEEINTKRQELIRIEKEIAENKTKIESELIQNKSKIEEQLLNSKSKLESDIKERQNIALQEISKRQIDLKKKEEELLERENKLNQIESDIEKKNLSLNEKSSEIEKKNLEIDEKLESANKKLKELEDKESMLNRQIQSLKDRIEEENKKIEIEKSLIKEDREELKIELDNLQDMKSELIEKERYLESTRDNLEELHNEIKKWENSHWKIKKK